MMDGLYLSIQIKTLVVLDIKVNKKLQTKKGGVVFFMTALS